MALYHSPEYHSTYRTWPRNLTVIHDDYINKYNNVACLMDYEI